MEREIYSEISAPSAIGHPPSSVVLTGSGEKLVTGFEENNASTVHIDVYVHCAKCTGAEARALGSDFDGYVRITIFENGQTIARAQMDYKGEPSPQMIQKIYDTLIQKLQWSHQ